MKNEIELRLAECLGVAGTAEVTLNLPHRGAELTDLVGGRREPLSGGPTYRFPVRPQQIVTLRFRVRNKLAELGLEFVAGRLLAYRVASMQAKGQIPNAEASMTTCTSSGERFCNVGSGPDRMTSTWAPDWVNLEASSTAL